MDILQIIFFASGSLVFLLIAFYKFHQWMCLEHMIGYKSAMSDAREAIEKAKQ